MLLSNKKEKREIQGFQSHDHEAYCFLLWQMFIGLSEEAVGSIFRVRE
jgi:hypothetical protein